MGARPTEPKPKGNGVLFCFCVLFLAENEIAEAYLSAPSRVDMEGTSLNIIQNLGHQPSVSRPLVSAHSVERLTLTLETHNNHFRTSPPEQAKYQ